MSPLTDLPETLRKAFSTTYDGFIAAVVPSASEANNLAAGLKARRISFRQKTIKRKRKANQFVVMVIPQDALT